jgi:hypothetical protein
MGLGSGIQKKPIPDPGSGPRGSKKAPYPGSRIRIRNTEFFQVRKIFLLCSSLLTCEVDVLNRDSGIDTSSCFTGSEDSNHRDSRTSKVRTKHCLSTKPKSTINLHRSVLKSMTAEIVS